MHTNPALTGIKRYVRTPRSDAFPVLGAHVSGSKFQYPDLTWKELCDQMAHLVADLGGDKGQLSYLVEAICVKNE